MATKDPAQKAKDAFAIGVLLQEDLKQVDEAIKYYNKAIGFEPDLEKACQWRYGLAQVYMTVKRPTESVKLLKEVLKLSQNEITKQRTRRLLEQIKEE